MTSAPADSEPLFIERGATWRWLGLPIGAVIGLMVLEWGTTGSAHWIGWALFGVIAAACLSVQIYAARLHTSVELTEDTLRCGEESIPVARIIGIVDEYDDGKKFYPDDDDWDEDDEYEYDDDDEYDDDLGDDEYDDVADLDDDDDEDADDEDGDDAREPHWREAPSLGYLSTVPRRRRSIGLHLAPIDPDTAPKPVPGGPPIRRDTLVRAWAIDHIVLRERLVNLVERDG